MLVLTIGVAKGAVLAYPERGRAAPAVLPGIDPVLRIEDAKRRAAVDLTLSDPQPGGVGTGPRHLDGEAAFARLEPDGSNEVVDGDGIIIEGIALERLLGVQGSRQAE
jgi:hypothetical protein